MNTIDKEFEKFKKDRENNFNYKLICSSLVFSVIESLPIFFGIRYFGNNTIDFPPHFWIAPVTFMVLSYALLHQYSLFRVYIEYVSRGTEMVQFFFTIGVCCIILASFALPKYWMLFAAAILLIWGLTTLLFRIELSKKPNIYVINGKIITNPVIEKMKTGFWITTTYSLSAAIMGILISFILDSDLPTNKKVASQLLPGGALVVIVSSSLLVFPRFREALESNIKSFLQKKKVIGTSNNRNENDR